MSDKSLAGKKIAILVADGFEQVELTGPREALDAAGADTSILSLKPGNVRAWKFIGLRAEIRDFYTGSPAYNSAIRGGQHNVVAGGGIVLKFGGRE